MRCFLTTARLFALALTMAATGCMASPADEADESLSQAEEGISGKSAANTGSLCGLGSEKTGVEAPPSAEIPPSTMPSNIQPPVASGCAGQWSEMPSYQAPSHEAPVVSAPGYAAPSFGAPSYSAPVFQAPNYQAPNYQAPTPAPVWSAPNYSAPSYAGPTYQAPIYQAPSYAAPSFPAPIYLAPTYAPANPLLPAHGMSGCVGGFSGSSQGYGAQTQISNP